MATQVPADLGPQPVALDELPFGRDFFEKVLDALYDGVYFVDQDRRILFWNQGAELLSGYSPAEVLGSYCHADILQHTNGNGCNLCRGDCPLVKTIRTGLPICERVFLRHKDRRRIAVDVYTMPRRDDRNEIIGAVEVFRDASSVVALENAYSRLSKTARKDPLTGVANRRYMDRIVDDQLALLKRTGIPFSIIIADIDHFKQINDTLGHAVGDKALLSFAQELQRHCRKTDVAARIGGDEFLLLLRQQRLESAVQAAERMKAGIMDCLPPELAGRRLTASFGVTEAIPEDNNASILERADRALYRAKAGGRGRVEWP